MATLDVLTYGFALNTDQGAFGYSTNSLLRVGGHNILIDTGPSSRRPFLYRALESKDLTTDDIDIVILTHMHWDHCQNTDLFRNARVLVNPTEIDYARNPNQWDLAVAAGMADMMRNMKVDVVSEGDTIVDGVTILETPGHTKGHMSVLAEVDGEKVLIAGMRFRKAAPSPAACPTISFGTWRTPTPALKRWWRRPTSSIQATTAPSGLRATR